MTDKERAEKLAVNVVDAAYYDHSVEYILAYADEIRRECAGKAVETIKKTCSLFGDGRIMCAEFDMVATMIRAAIMGKEKET